LCAHQSFQRLRRNRLVRSDTAVRCHSDKAAAVPSRLSGVTGLPHWVEAFYAAAQAPRVMPGQRPRKVRLGVSFAYDHPAGHSPHHGSRTPCSTRPFGAFTMSRRGEVIQGDPWFPLVGLLHANLRPPRHAGEPWRHATGFMTRNDLCPTIASTRQLAKQRTPSWAQAVEWSAYISM
jgi:hypothetical protein